MDVVSKLEILKNLGILNIIHKLLSSKTLNESSLFNLCDIVNSIGIFLLDSQFQQKEKSQMNTELYVNNLLSNIIYLFA